jgi:DNA-binding NarL/FixJ family response regulator
MLRGIRYVHKLQKYNIQGYVLKNAQTSELREAIQTVFEGATYFSKELNIASQKDDFRININIADTQVNEILSKREIEILRLICEEFSNAEIAEKLFLSISTIETHRKKLISKLGVNNTVGLVKYALKNNLID